MTPTRNELQCIEIALKYKESIIQPKDETSNFSFFKKWESKREANDDVKGEKAEVEYSVTDLKLFSVLWSEYGLEEGNLDDQLDCIKEWVNILFEKKVDIDLLCEQLKQKNEGIFNSFHFLRKGRFAHIELVPTIDMLPEEIDDVYGQYMETDNNYYLTIRR